MTVGLGRPESVTTAIWRLLVRLTLIALALYGFYRLRNIVTMIFIGAIMAYVLDPVVEWLARRPMFHRGHCGLSNAFTRGIFACKSLVKRDMTPPEPKIRLHHHALRVAATLYVFVMTIFVLWYGTKLIATPFVEEFRAAAKPQNQQKIKDGLQNALKWYDQRAPDFAKADKIQEQIRKSDFTKSLSEMAGHIGERVLESMKNIVEVVLLPVLAFYFIVDGHKLKREFVALVPRSRFRETLRMIREFNRIMRAFVAGQFILCFLAGIVVGAGLKLLGVDYAFVMGVLAGITRAIPIIGPIIGGIPIILLTLATKGVTTALLVLGFFTFLHFAESKFIMPMLLGDRMELHPVIIIVVLLVGGQVGGILIGGSIGALLGMFFAAPIASLARVMIRRYWLHLRGNGQQHASPAHNPLPARPAQEGAARIVD